MHIPVATYRIQFNPDFGFQAAKSIIPYLAELGISDIYASPIFRAKKGSTHGYDVVDPRSLNPELGEIRDFEELIEAARQAGLSWLQDIVPNHMAFDSENPMLMDIFENAEHSRYYRFFDIDWDHPYENIKGRLLAPFLGRFYAECLENQEIILRYDESGLSLNYYELRLPCRIESYADAFEPALGGLEQKLGAHDPDFTKFLGMLHFLNDAGKEEFSDTQYDQIAHTKRMLWELYLSNPNIKEFIDERIRTLNGEKGQPQSFTQLDRLISEQVFRLSFWKVAAEEINYRRFFTINGLISLKVEDEAVFNFTHELVFRFINEGKFQGVRVDHIDGLYDPTLYLKRLREKAKDTYIVAEKILSNSEKVPSCWEVQGTTGYDFMNCLNGLFCVRKNEKEFSKLYYKFTDMHTSYDDLVREKKRMIIGKHLAGNIDNLAQLLKGISSKDRYGRDITLYGLRRALVEVMANFPVYRTYINSERAGEEDRHYIKEAIYRAGEQLPGYVYELSFIEKFLLLDFPREIALGEKAQWIHFVMNFQQYTAPLMAKGFEDTILYVYNKLISLNEVGSNPNRFGFSADDFHNFNESRVKENPYALNASSTHDSKRGEDARARINVLSEMAREWEAGLKNWSRINKSKKKTLNGQYAPDVNGEYFLYQTLIGTFPFRQEEIPAFKERIKEYAIKAVREAKVHTAWIKPDTEYEEACTTFVDELLNLTDDNRFLKEFLPFQRKVAYYGIFNSLSQVLLKLTSPGIPDFYQGRELWDFTLVDPDNRRPVDFNERIRLLEGIKQGLQQDISGLIKEILSNKEDGRVKLFLIYRVLQRRREMSELFNKGSYLPLETGGVFKEHVIAFTRRYENQWMIALAPRFLTGLIKEGDLPLGESIWQDTHIIIPQDMAVLCQEAISAEDIQLTEKTPVGRILQCYPAGLLCSKD